MDPGDAVQPVLPGDQLIVPGPDDGVLPDYGVLYERLCHRFTDPALLTEALTHPSVSSQRGPRRARPPNYDRLEFLGDRVLGLVIAEHLFRTFADAEAGALARSLSLLVCRAALVDVAREIDLGAHVVLAQSERDTGGAGKPAILADTCEAIIAALYMDGGLEAARRFVDRYWLPRVTDPQHAAKDAKTMLQEWSQQRALGLPIYVLLSEDGAAHAPSFTIAVEIAGCGRAEGRGPSKRSAETAAAAAMLDKVADQ